MNHSITFCTYVACLLIMVWKYRVVQLVVFSIQNLAEDMYIKCTVDVMVFREKKSCNARWAYPSTDKEHPCFVLSHFKSTPQNRLACQSLIIIYSYSRVLIKY